MGMGLIGKNPPERYTMWRCKALVAVCCAVEPAESTPTLVQE
jgi:hypothetical protein